MAVWLYGLYAVWIQPAVWSPYSVTRCVRCMGSIQRCMDCMVLYGPARCMDMAGGTAQLPTADGAAATAAARERRMQRKGQRLRGAARCDGRALCVARM